MKGNGDAREPLTTEQAATIVMLMQRIGIDADSSSMLEAQERMGGPGMPHGYLMLSKAQGTRLLEMMTAFLGHLEREQAPAVVEAGYPGGVMRA